MVVHSLLLTNFPSPSFSYIYQSLNYKSKYVIYLLKFLICKLQYAGINTVSHKVKQSPEKIKDPGAILACKHFNSPNHDYKAHGKFTIIEQLRSISSLSTEFLKEKIKQREHFWIKKLKTHVPYGLNQKVN